MSKRLLHLAIVSLLLYLGCSFLLSCLHLWIDSQQTRYLREGGNKLVYAHDDAFTFLGFLHVAIGGVLNFSLLVALLNSRYGASQAIDLGDVLGGFRFQSVGKGFYIVRPAQGINNIGDATFVSQKLLSAYSSRHCFFRRRGISFIEGVGMQ
ncbi:hypothetical protein ES703_110060 [subsurface metagenome]